MKFFVGLTTGLVLGAAGAVIYSVKSGRDLREAFEEIRSEMNRRDVDALGARLDARVTEIQARFEERIAQVRDRGATAAGEAVETAADAVSEAKIAASEAGGTADDAVEAAVEVQPGA